jgi:hypothetical protein
MCCIINPQMERSGLLTQVVKNAYGNTPLSLTAKQACKAVLRRILEGGGGALQRLRNEMDAAAAALKEREEKERLEWEERCRWVCAESPQKLCQLTEHLALRSTR